mmetsp:Transcript_1784/g.5194  ORF Transcript_1784/g.5194 Transcript_1784/m.5194 type:complete len:376 (+) Transcript_1784:81-1208(+)
MRRVRLNLVEKLISTAAEYQTQACATQPLQLLSLSQFTSSSAPLGANGRAARFAQHGIRDVSGSPLIRSYSSECLQSAVLTSTRGVSTAAAAAHLSPSGLPAPTGSQLRCGPVWASGTVTQSLVQRPPSLSEPVRRLLATRVQQQRHQRLGRAGWRDNPNEQALYLIALTVAMVGITYASVPLYRMFCQATGYGGTVAEGTTVEAKLRARAEKPDPATEAAAAARELTVSFNADCNDGMPWKFLPSQGSVKVRPGQSTLAFYTAENVSDKVITGVSTYNVTPQQAGTYFNKIQCFCFEEQKLRPGEKIDMPVFFYLDPEFATDPRMKKVNHLTLSYTFFKVAEEEVADVPYTGPAVANLCAPEDMPTPTPARATV